jgi:hypothetical protein
MKLRLIHLNSVSDTLSKRWRISSGSGLIETAALATELKAEM